MANFFFYNQPGIFILLLTFNTVNYLFRTDGLCRLMHSATLNHIHLIKNPDFNLASKITMDAEGARRLQQTKSLAFGSSGEHSSLVLSSGTTYG